jgi:hypothetical protein
MSVAFRSFLAILMVVTLLGVTAYSTSVTLAAEIAAAVDPCCEDDCPEDPACDTTCAMMARSGMQLPWPLQAPVLTVAALGNSAALPIFDQPPLVGLALDGLKRPPRI